MTFARADPHRRPHLGRLRAIVQSRMWKWLFDAHRLLGVSIEILDDGFGVLVASREGRVLRERFEHERGQPLQAVLRASATGDAPFMIAGSGVRLACAPIIGADVLAGAVLVSTDEPVRLSDGDVARVGALLANALADQLSRPAAEHRGHLHQISALYQLLQTAIATGSEREVIRTFAEALSVWDEIEVLAYRADLGGRYALMLALPGSDPAAVPRVIVHAPSVQEPRLRRLTPAERTALGFAGDGGTVLAQLASEGGRWLVAMNSPRGVADSERSDMYVAALGHALNGCVAVETSRLTWAVMQHFVEREQPVEAAGRAMNELSRVIGASGSFVVYGPDHAAICSIGDGRSSPHAPSSADAYTLRASIAAPAPFVAVVEMHASAGQRFSPRDLKLFEVAVAAFAAWLPSAVRRLTSGERRGVARSFDQIVDRYARESHDTRDAASLILISAGDAGLSIDVTHAWIKRLRPQLRPTDLAGRLASGELGILLLQTPSAGAHVVARRLSRVLSAALLDDSEGVRIGVASQLADTVGAGSLIERARLQATRPASLN